MSGALQWDPDPELRRWFGIAAGDEVEDVVLEFDAHVARYVRERDWHPTATLEQREGGGVRLRMRTGGFELERFVLEWGQHVRVVRPRSLRERVARVLAEALRQYEEQPREGASGTG